ncbi:uncharacterized protein IL334_005490 [Kwoniella shivajii]|uniref:Uncharacterized protein n=1 Tax=Kwoniella shivajii TaxID=564305 RepID=A0ABZ1D3A2_9TREE|nr:hypothetical protein IL334_005490 [Kwoniella shivajii]
MPTNTETNLGPFHFPSLTSQDHTDSHVRANIPDNKEASSGQKDVSGSKAEKEIENEESWLCSLPLDKPPEVISPSPTRPPTVMIISPSGKERKQYFPSMEEFTSLSYSQTQSAPSDGQTSTSSCTISALTMHYLKPFIPPNDHEDAIAVFNETDFEIMPFTPGTPDKMKGWSRSFSPWTSSQENNVDSPISNPDFIATPRIPIDHPFLLRQMTTNNEAGGTEVHEDEHMFDRGTFGEKNIMRDLVERTGRVAVERRANSRSFSVYSS